MRITGRQILVLALAFLTVVFGTVFMFGSFEQNDAQEWQIVQSVEGDLTIRDDPGFYFSNFATVWTWPRARQTRFDNVRVTFNDGGTATLSGSLRYRMPVTADERIVIHREFNGKVENVDQAVLSHLKNCVKVTGPIMSGSENQSARKAEFNQVVHEQLQRGLFESRKVLLTVKDVTDTSGKEITIAATEIVTDADGTPHVQQTSPLAEYGIEVVQFSIEETEYDTKTLEQFAAKKDAFLAAERSKAERSQEVEARLMIVERGLREKAEVEAVALKEKARLIVEADQRVEVAIRQKTEAVTVAQRQVEIRQQEVAEQQALRDRAVLEAEQKRDVAALQLAQDRLRAEGIRALAEAEEYRIQKGGAVTEKESRLAEIAARRDVEVAQALSRIATPSTVIVGAGGDGDGNAVSSTLMNMLMLRTLGVLPATQP